MPLGQLSQYYSVLMTLLTTTLGCYQYFLLYIASMYVAIFLLQWNVLIEHLLLHISIAVFYTLIVKFPVLL